MLNLRASARNINLIILITKDRGGGGGEALRSAMPYKYRCRPQVFDHVQSAKVVLLSPRASNLSFAPLLPFANAFCAKSEISLRRHRDIFVSIPYFSRKRTYERVSFESILKS